jgi:3D-(3,5/4)-trihydroxycyclohexane-1,2-dione acylhydrolase (decyclizing)
MPETISLAGGTTPPDPPENTVRLTVSQALVKFLGAQYSESDGQEQRLFAGCFGIFGHGNVAGIGQALLQAELACPDRNVFVIVGDVDARVHPARAQDLRRTQATQKLFL